MAMNVWNSPPAAARAYRRALAILEEERRQQQPPSSGGNDDDKHDTADTTAVTVTADNVENGNVGDNDGDNDDYGWLEEATCRTELAQLYLDHGAKDNNKDNPQELYVEARQFLERTQRILERHSTMMDNDGNRTTSGENDNGDNDDNDDDNDDAKEQKEKDAAALQSLRLKYIVAHGHALWLLGNEKKNDKDTDNDNKPHHHQFWQEAALQLSDPTDRAQLWIRIGAKLRQVMQPTEAASYLERAIALLLVLQQQHQQQQQRQDNNDGNDNDDDDDDDEEEYDNVDDLLTDTYAELCQVRADEKEYPQAIAAGQEYVRLIKERYHRQQDQQQQQEQSSSSSPESDHDIATMTASPTDPTTTACAQACEFLATIYREAGHLSQSVTLYREALLFWNCTDRVECAVTHNSLGFVLEQLATTSTTTFEEKNRHLEEARTSCREALRILNQHDPIPTHHHEKAHYCIGSTFAKQEAWNECLDHWEKALQVSRALVQRRQVDPGQVIDTLLQLIEACQNKAKQDTKKRKRQEASSAAAVDNNKKTEESNDAIQKAHEYRQEAYDLFVQHLSEDDRLQHPAFLNLCHDMAQQHWTEDGDDDSTETQRRLELLQQALRGWQKLLPNSLKTAMAAIAVGTRYHELKQLGPALEHFELALGIATHTGEETLSGSNDTNGKTDSSNHSDKNNKSRDDDDNNDDPDNGKERRICQALAQYNKGNVLHEQGNLAVARASCEEAISALSSLEQQQILLPKLLFSLGTIQQDQNQIDLAKETLGKALGFQRELLSSSTLNEDDGLLETIQKTLQTL
eukprot:CAMPEP_0168829682 /NCGR_PEP_ID=MMETSP0727-20121128/1144_1 /TAXON_ID=265536 /ORGANISM="Amphiprora sp., Strain CCMP467" /LENGTH=802 /DNA_ID=CAMNT_0008882895 /DNA_START=30 /DNA_END=2435 /DNA_ORIENTATION=-